MITIEQIAANSFAKKIYYQLKDYQDKRKLSYKGQFINRSQNKKKLCYILAGFKPFLYPAVFGRLEQYLDEDIDVCICSAGVYSEELAQLAERHNWSYLSTKNKNVALVQNVAIDLHPAAEYIFKLDEDIFITEGFFSNLFTAYVETKEKSKYFPGVMAPLIPINGYGHARVLEKLGLTDYYAKHFEAVRYMAGPSRKVESSPEVARFFWGEGGFVPTIDDMAQRFANEPQEVRPCPIRFSIGAILFERALWQEMRYFSVNRFSIGLGSDEVEICEYCLTNSRPLMVSENVLVGHLSFGKQNKPMAEYFEENKTLFLPPLNAQN